MILYININYKFEVKDVEDSAQYKVERNIYLFTFVKKLKTVYY